jgi:ubiquinone/menaquinone biosynthesis C-methylase UbiE
MWICPSYLSFVLYNPIRKAFTDRRKILEESGIRESSVVLEIGAGNGFITEAIARQAKKVYALELQAGMVRKLNKRMKRFGDTVEIIKGDAGTYPLKSGFADVALMYYSFHEVSEHAAAGRNIAQTVKPGGIIAIYEPKIEVNKSRMLESVRIFEAAGFVKEAAYVSLFTRFVKLRKRSTSESALS